MTSAEVVEKVKEQGLALQQLFPYKSSCIILLKIRTIMKSPSLMMGASNWAILTFSTCFYQFWHSLSYTP